MMRFLCAALISLAISSGMALAAENFIPQGHSYSPSNELLPPLNSREDQINRNTDLLETEIYVEQRQQKQFESQMNRFIYDQEPGGANDLPDY
jgi:hypothetical protein